MKHSSGRRQTSACVLASLVLQGTVDGSPGIKRSFYESAVGIPGFSPAYEHERVLAAGDSPTYPCGSILASFSKDEFVALAERFVDVALHDSVLPQIRHGIQVRKLCASCRDFEDSSSLLPEKARSDTSSFDYVCGPDAYGSEAVVSGLAVFPVDKHDEEFEFVPGLYKSDFFMHGTIVETHAVPSDVFSETLDDNNLRVGMLLASVTPDTVTILPDYLGYGESGFAGDNPAVGTQAIRGNLFYKSYLVKRAYQTATLPLWLEARRIVNQESNCTSELGDTVIVNGYSEGGYAAVAAADGLSSVGADVLTVQAGGGPYDLSQVTSVIGAKNLLASGNPYIFSHFVALWGTAYSSTNFNLPNFGKGQDLLDPVYRDQAINWTVEGLSVLEIVNQIPVEEAGELGPMILINSEMLNVTLRAIADNIISPCTTYDTNLTFLCAALQENDLLTTISNSPYPNRLCHGTDDTIVPFENLPLNDSNVDAEVKEGKDHFSAAPECIGDWVGYIMIAFASLEGKSSGACPNVTIDEEEEEDPPKDTTSSAKRSNVRSERWWWKSLWYMSAASTYLFV